jgi:hypothetical protein
MTHHDKVSDKEIKRDETASFVEQPNSGLEAIPALQDTATIPADEEKMKTRGKDKDKDKGKNKDKASGSGYTGLNKYRADMLCSSCGRSMVQTGAIGAEDVAATKKIPLRGDGKPAYKPMPGVGANKGLAVTCDDCRRQSKPPEEGGTNMPITYKTLVVMTQEGKVINVPVSALAVK